MSDDCVAVVEPSPLPEGLDAGARPGNRLETAGETKAPFYSRQRRPQRLRGQRSPPPGLETRWKRLGETKRNLNLPKAA